MGWNKCERPYSLPSIFGLKQKLYNISRIRRDFMYFCLKKWISMPVLCVCMLLQCIHHLHHANSHKPVSFCFRRSFPFHFVRPFCAISIKNPLRRSDPVCMARVCWVQCPLLCTINPTVGLGYSLARARLLWWERQRDREPKSRSNNIKMTINNGFAPFQNGFDETKVKQIKIITKTQMKSEKPFDSGQMQLISPPISRFLLPSTASMDSST